MKRKLIFSFIFFLLFGASVADASSFELNERVHQAYLQIIRLKFESGKRMLDDEQRLNPSNKFPLLYYSYIDFLKAFISEEKKDFETFKINADERLKKLKDDDSPFCLYSRAEVMMQDAMLRIKFREFISAAWEIRKAYKIVEENSKAHPQFLLNKKLMGFLHVLVGAIPQNYLWLVKLAGMEGTIIQGTDELNTLLKETGGTSFSFYKEEILFYLASINNSFSKNDSSSIVLIETMKPFCSESPLMRYCSSNLLMKLGKNDDALKTLTDTAVTKESFPFYFLSYKTGLAKMRVLDLSAENDFRKYRINFHGMNYVRSAYQKLAWIYLLRGDEKKYFEWIGLCKKNGNDFVDEDKDATEESNSGEVPNKILLRSRLLFDGGYYSQSLAEITGKPLESFPRFKDLLEVTYRFARLLHKMNQPDKAIEYFESTIKNGASSKYYFAANAALLLGNIYEEKNDFEKAKKYYQQCLSMRNHEYQNSIDQKAKAGLERLNVKN